MQNYDFPNNCEDYIHRIGRTGVCIGTLLRSLLPWLTILSSARV